MGKHFEGPYNLTSVVIEAVDATINSPEVPEHDEAETVHNMSEENKLYFKAEKEAIFLLLTVLGVKSTQCDDAHTMRCGPTLMTTNRFTSRDGESMESYYSRFYKLMNELTRNNLQVTTMQVNVQFLQQLQPECDPEQLRGLRIAKEFGTLAQYFKKLYKPTNNNFELLQNLRNKTEDTTTRSLYMKKSCSSDQPLEQGTKHDGK
ncbi:hypothetical protein Tco_1105245 [Tanacetum coccineum]